MVSSEDVHLWDTLTGHHQTFWEAYRQRLTVYVTTDNGHKFLVTFVSDSRYGHKTNLVRLLYAGRDIEIISSLHLPPFTYILAESVFCTYQSCAPLSPTGIVVEQGRDYIGQTL